MRTVIAYWNCGLWCYAHEISQYYWAPDNFKVLRLNGEFSKQDIESIIWELIQ